MLRLRLGSPCVRADSASAPGGTSGSCVRRRDGEGSLRMRCARLINEAPHVLRGAL